MQIGPLPFALKRIKRELCKEDDLETLQDFFYIPRRLAKSLLLLYNKEDEEGKLQKGTKLSVFRDLNFNFTTE